MFTELRSDVRNPQIIRSLRKIIPQNIQSTNNWRLITQHSIYAKVPAKVPAKLLCTPCPKVSIYLPHMKREMSEISGNE